MKREIPRPAELVFDGWFGPTYYAVTIVRETRGRYEIRADHEPVRLAGRRWWLPAGHTTMVPKRAIREVTPAP